MLLKLNRRAFLGATAAPLLAPAQKLKNAPSILLISSWAFKNIGDIAITPGFLRLVERHFPEAEVTVAAANVYDEIRDYLGTRFPKCKVIKMPFQPGVPIPESYKAAFQRANLLVLNSGMTMSYGYYGLEWEKYMGRVLAFMMARNAQKPFGVYGHSFDKVEPHADIVYSDILSSAAFIYTRDSESVKLLKSKGVHCPEMAFGPDSTFGFDLRDEARCTTFMREHRLEPRKFIALIPRFDANRFVKDGAENRHAAQTIELVTRYVRQTGDVVVVVPEVQGQIEPARTMLIEKLPDDVRKLVRFKPDFWLPDEAFSLYAKARAVVSMEMHSVILGLAAGTPSLHPYFKQAGLKQWMMRDIGLPDWMFDIDAEPIDKLHAAMLQIHTNLDGALGRVRKAMGFVKQRQIETMAVVRRAALSGLKAN